MVVHNMKVDKEQEFFLMYYILRLTFYVIDK